jgi:hypothetical protein
MSFLGAHKLKPGPHQKYLDPPGQQCNLLCFIWCNLWWNCLWKLSNIYALPSSLNFYVTFEQILVVVAWMNKSINHSFMLCNFCPVLWLENNFQHKYSKKKSYQLAYSHKRAAIHWTQWLYSVMRTQVTLETRVANQTDLESTRTSSRRRSHVVVTWY